MRQAQATAYTLVKVIIEQNAYSDDARILIGTADYHKLVNYLCVKTKYPILFKHNYYLHSKVLYTIKLVCYNYIAFTLYLRIVRIGLLQVSRYDNERVLCLLLHRRF